MPKRNNTYSGEVFNQSVYLFTTIVAFFAGVISAPIFMYLSNNYYDIMTNMGNGRVTMSLFLFWMILTIAFAVFFSEFGGFNTLHAKPVYSKSKSKSKRR